MGVTLGILVEASVAVLLLVTVGYCWVLNNRLQRLHADRDALQKMIGDLVQATGLANAAVGELKTAALEADAKLALRLAEANELDRTLHNNVATGTALIEKIARITAAARMPIIGETARPADPKSPQPVEPQSRLASALQQLAMRPGIGGKVA